MTARSKVSSMKTQETLLIFENVPESTDLYLIPNAPEWVALAHGLYINHVDCPSRGPAREALDRLNDALAEKPEHCATPDGEWACAFRKYRLKDDKPIVTKGRVKIVRCGFLM
jgi:hypothetical protein